MNGSADTLHGGLACSEVSEMAGMYVLGALSGAEREQVAAHLADCPAAHAEIEELGGAIPALALAADPVEAPAALRSRVMAAYRADVGAPAVSPVRLSPVTARSVSMPVYRRPVLAWAAALAAVLVLAVLGGYTLTVQQRADQAAQRAQQVAAAIDVLAQPDSTIAFLTGTGSATGAHGFAAFPADGAGYLVMVGLPDAGAGMTYQAWYLVNGQPSSAGLLAVDAGGYAVLGDLSGMAGAGLVALTIERAGGVDQPTSDPVAVGELRANSAAS
jgi:hypothetical protein